MDDDVFSHSGSSLLGVFLSDETVTA